MFPPPLILVLSPPPAGRCDSVQPHGGGSGSCCAGPIRPALLIPQNLSQTDREGEICRTGQISCAVRLLVWTPDCPPTGCSDTLSMKSDGGGLPAVSPPKLKLLNLIGPQR